MTTSFRTARFATLFFLALPMGSQAEEQASTAMVLRGLKYQLVYADAEKLPNFEIDGEPARIHTQGIYLTSRSLYVTGRLERKPKQALLLRFDRANLRLLESLDITPDANTKDVGKNRLDHPGGFDYDGTCFWIPVAVSKRHSATAIVKVCTKLDSKLSKNSVETAFVLDDHIGALAFDRQQGRLYGANWNTKLVYVWQRDGTLLERMPRESLLEDQPEWSLAVQDWKAVGEGILIAGGLDKSPLRKPSQPGAVIQWIDLSKGQTLDSIRLPSPSSESHSITREGMAFFEEHLFLLPGDLGENAILYRWRVEPIGE